MVLLDTPVERSSRWIITMLVMMTMIVMMTIIKMMMMIAMMMMIVMMMMKTVTNCDDCNDSNDDDSIDEDDDTKCGQSRGSGICCQYDQYSAVSMPLLFYEDDDDLYNLII